MTIANQACEAIRTAEKETVERWIRERTEFPDDLAMGEVLVGEEAQRAITAEVIPAVQRFQELLRRDGPPADWQERAKEVLAADTMEALTQAGTLTDLADMARDGLVGVIRMDDGDFRPFRTIDVALGIDTPEMLRDGPDAAEEE